MGNVTTVQQCTLMDLMTYLLEKVYIVITLRIRNLELKTNCVFVLQLLYHCYLYFNISTT